MKSMEKVIVENEDTARGLGSLRNPTTKTNAVYGLRITPEALSKNSVSSTLYNREVGAPCTL